MQKNAASAFPIFVLSLDFELYWGLRDVLDPGAAREAVLGAREAIPRILDLFREAELHATWATVGLLFFDTRNDMMEALPELRPAYDRAELDPYQEFNRLGPDEVSDPMRFGGSLVRMIRETPHQEIGTHTFSHYFCLEPGQTEETFRADLDAARRTAEANGIKASSMVLPKNQINAAYLPAMADAGVKAYRGQIGSKLYAPTPDGPFTKAVKLLRLADSYRNLSGHGGWPLKDAGSHPPFDIRASRFLRPWSPRLSAFEPLKLKRITRGMTHAAENNLVYHLWWHPHNFGPNTDRNLETLAAVAGHFQALRRSHGMRSLNMGEVAKMLL